MHKLPALAALLLSLLAHAEPAPGLTVDQAIEEAKIHNPAYLRAQAAAHEAGWGKLEALSGNLPHLSASASHFFDQKFQVLTVPFGGNFVSFPAIYPLTVFSLDATWTVFDGLQTPLAYSAASLNKQAADLELSRTALQLEGGVRLAFYRALGAQALDEVAAANVKTLEDHLAKTKELLARGKVTRFDTLRVQVQLDEALPEMEKADDELVLARRELAVAMGLAEDPRPLSGALPVPAEPKLPADLKPEVKDRDDVQALLDRSEAASHAYHSTYGAFIPKVSFGGQIQEYNNINNNLSVTDPSTFKTDYNLGVFLTWNIFDGGAAIARSREAAYRAQEAEHTAEAAVLRAPQEVETWRRRLIYGVSLYKARARAIETAEESVRLAKLGYTAGTRTNTDVLDAELDLFRARAGAVRAQLDTAEATTNLELALGHRI